MTFDPPLSILQTAAALNISRTAVYDLLKAGTLNSVKLNGKTLVRSTEVEQFSPRARGEVRAVARASGVSETSLTEAR